MSYKQLSASERQQIFLLRYQQHLTLRAIAQKLARSASTISRELQRNHPNKLYLQIQLTVLLAIDAHGVKRLF